LQSLTWDPALRAALINTKSLHVFEMHAFIAAPLPSISAASSSSNSLSWKERRFFDVFVIFLRTQTTKPRYLRCPHKP
jgi:hypothetical protein